MNKPREPKSSAARLAGAACALALGACGMLSTESPPCRPEMPSASQVRKNPAFASLTYRNHVNYEATRGAGYDIWADSKFEYRAGLQFSLVPHKDTRGASQFCVPDVALRVAMPLDAQRREMLDAFVRAVAPPAGVDPAQLMSRLDQLAATREKYRTVEKGANATVESGIVSSANRGEFFVVAFIWPSP